MSSVVRYYADARIEWHLVRQQKYFADISSRRSFKNSFHSVRVSLVRGGLLV